MEEVISVKAIVSGTAFDSEKTGRERVRRLEREETLHRLIRRFPPPKKKKKRKNKKKKKKKKTTHPPNKNHNKKKKKKKKTREALGHSAAPATSGQWTCRPYAASVCRKKYSSFRTENGRQMKGDEKRRKRIN